VNAVPVEFFVARREFLTSALSRLPSIAHLSHLSMWMGAAALEQKSRVAFSPYINVIVKGDMLGETCENNENTAECQDFLHLYGDIVKKQLWSSSRYTRHKKYAN
jgi:hypothetical protein